LASFAAGFVTLRVSSLLENYVLLTVAMLLLMGGSALLFRTPRASASPASDADARSPSSARPSGAPRPSDL
jgi:hypothetical protein